MIMESPGRCDDKITHVHGDLFTVYSCIGTATMQDEPQGGLGMAVRRSCFTGKYQLQTGVQAVRNAGAPTQPGILTNQDPPFRFLSRNEGACLLNPRPNGIPLPQIGQAGCLRLGRNERMQNFPKGRAIADTDSFIELLPAGVHRWLMWCGQAYLQGSRFDRIGIIFHRLQITCPICMAVRRLFRRPALCESVRLR